MEKFYDTITKNSNFIFLYTYKYIHDLKIILYILEKILSIVSAKRKFLKCYIKAK